MVGIIVALVFFVFQNQPTSHFFSEKILTISRPFWKIGDNIKSWFNSNLTVFKGKKSLGEENQKLRDKISELEAKFLSYETIEQENHQLKESLLRTGEQKFLLSYIISRPPQSPYDALIIDAGSENGLQKGMEVTAYGDVLIGYIGEVFPKNSKVKLVSFPNTETNTMIASLNIPAIVVGRGGSNMEIVLTKSIEVKPGEKVITLGIKPLVVGIIERIESDPSDPTQKLLLRLPVNIHELRHVMIKL